MAQINDDYLKLPGSYLFADIAHKGNAFKEKPKTPLKWSSSASGSVT